MAKRINAHVERQKAKTKQDCNTLATLVSYDMLLKDAAVTMGISQGRVWQLWRKVREGLGVPARD